MSFSSGKEGKRSKGTSKDGDSRGTFEELVVSCDRRLYNLVLRLVQDPDDAADVTQEAFLKAYRAWEGFQGRSSPYTWLCQIAINLCRNRARDRARWNEEPIADEEFVSSEPTPEQHVSKAELSEKVRAAIDGLPGNYRVVAVLRELQGLTYEEIAEAASLSVPVVKTRLARARGMLRRKLEAYL